MPSPDEPGAPPREKYWAFLSYSHQDNLRTRKDGRTDCIQWAEWLLGAIETYRVPVEFRDRRTATGEPMPERFFPLFQDEKELPISSDLGGSIRAALDQSRFLIVICSPRSAASKYVNEEVRYFNQTDRKNRVLALIVDGEPNATLGNKTGYAPTDDCFCPALREASPAIDPEAASEETLEPIAGDVRIKDALAVREPRQSDLATHRHVLSHMRLKLLAALMGVGFDELVQRDDARRRRRRRLIATATTTLLLIFAVLSVISTVFYFRASRAEQAAKSALERSVELLQTTARNDVWEALNLLRQRREARAFPLLARALENDPDSATAAQTAIGALNAMRLRPATFALAGHTKAIHFAGFNTAGTRLVTASEDGTAAIWDRASGRLLASLAGHTGPVKSARFSADGARVVTASEDQSARIWDAADGRLLLMLPHAAALRRAQFSHDGRRVLTISEDRKAQLWDAALGTRLREFPADGTVYGGTFSPDDRWIATASNDTRARVWDAETGALLATLGGHKGAVHSVSFSPDGTLVATASSDQSVRVWDVAGHPLATLEGHGRSVLGASFSPDGTRVLSASDDGTARLWDAVSGRLLVTFAGHDGPVKSAHFSDDGRRVVTASDDGTARLWDAASGRLLATLAGHGGAVQSAVFSADGEQIATASTDATARVWETGLSSMVVEISGHQGGLQSARFDAGDREVLTLADDQTFRRWDAVSGRLIATDVSPDDRVLTATAAAGQTRLLTSSWDDVLQVRSAADAGARVRLARPLLGLNAASFSADGMLLATADVDHIARVWDTASGVLRATFAGHEAAVNHADFSGDGTRIVTASDDGTARVWEIASGRLLVTLRGHTGPVLRAHFSPDDTLIATASEDRTARVWNAATGELTATLTGHEGAVHAAAFSADGSRLVTASFDRTARVWERRSGALLASLSGHEGPVLDASFSADGQRVVTASTDQIARVWVLPELTERAPTWFPLFLRWRVSCRFDDSGAFRAETAREQETTRQTLARLVQAGSPAERGSPIARIARWFLAPPAERTVHPFANEARGTAADGLIRPDASAEVLAHAYALDPRHPLIHTALARFEGNATRADFLRSFSPVPAPAGAANLPDLSGRRAALLAPPASASDPRVSSANGIDFCQVTRSAPFGNGLGMEFVPIPGAAVLVARWPTRVEDYAAFAAATNRAWPRPSFWQPGSHPAVNVHWGDANEFCAWLTARERASGRLGTRQRYRLPTDREWSAAAGMPVEIGATPRERSREASDLHPWGTGWPPPRGAGNYDQRLRVDDHEFTSAVGSFGRDRNGLCDLGGNVWQWCEDHPEPGSKNRVLRGGSWADILRESLLSRYRASRGPLDRHPNFGFRIVLAGDEER